MTVHTHTSAALSFFPRRGLCAEEHKRFLALHHCMPSARVGMEMVFGQHETEQSHAEHSHHHDHFSSDCAATTIQAAVRAFLVRKKILRCPICLILTNQVRTWPGKCGHLLCESCGLSWLRRSARCPLCRGEAGAFVVKPFEGASTTSMLEEIERVRTLLWNNHLAMPQLNISIRSVWLLAIGMQEEDRDDDDGVRASERQSHLQPTTLTLNLEDTPISSLSTSGRPPPSWSSPRLPEPPPPELVALKDQLKSIGVERYGEAAPAEVSQSLERIAVELWHWRQIVARAATMSSLRSMFVFVTGCAVFAGAFVLFLLMEATIGFF